MHKISKIITFVVIFVCGIFLFSGQVLAAPIIINTSPSGVLPEGTTDVTLSFGVDSQAASCKWDTSSGFDYGTDGEYLNDFGGFVFSSNPIPGFTDNGATYTYYAICVDGSGFFGPEATITFSSYQTIVQTETPHADPVGGTYSAPVSVSISTATLFDTIYYTTDGSTPTRSSTMDTIGNTIEISSTTTLKAFAVMDGYLDSDIMTETYTISGSTGPPASPTVTSVTPGNGQILVSFTPGTGGGVATSYTATCLKDGGGMFSQNESTSDPIIVDIGMDNNGYTFNCTVNAINDIGGASANSITGYPDFNESLAGAPVLSDLRLLSASPSQNITTTLNDNPGGIDVFSMSPIFSASTTEAWITLGTNANSNCTLADTLEMIDTQYTNNSQAHTFNPFNVAPPFLSKYIYCTNSTSLVRSEVYQVLINVDGSIVDPDVINGVCGSANGVPSEAAPTTNLCSAGTASPVSNDGSQWLWGCNGSGGGTNATCTAPIYVAPLDQVIAPTSSPAAGTYTSAQSVTLSSATSGATIYYTTNGSTPTASSTQYSGAISISSTTTLKAIAIKSGMTNSTVMSSAYTISLPTATVGNVSAGIDKTVSSSTTLSGSATGTGITYAWTKQSGPGSLVFGSASSATTTVSANTDGVYIVRLTATDSSGASAYDDMYLTWDTSFPYAEFISFQTTDTTPQISGTYTGSPVGITLYIGSYSFPAAINENGTWRVVDNTITPPLSKNTYSVRIRAFDLAGNTSDTYANLKITDSDSSSSSSSDDNDSDEEEKNAKQIKNSKKTVKNGDYIVQSGKNFPKKSKVLVYFQRNNESYYPPKVVYTDSKGKFSIKYKVNKPKGVYNWFVQDYKSGKKVWSKYRVR
ncbi:MAG: chitobiase/beta-hexosaminidase C-terminal domain-containing protein [Candidatus Moranbacteria bacterium]|nr:chitobiase/beta-hexosaminidase C-terminal domain-containing protein [Candidatus Moranbacteria bacterium]